MFGAYLYNTPKFEKKGANSYIYSQTGEGATSKYYKVIPNIQAHLGLAQKHMGWEMGISSQKNWNH